MMAFTTLSPLGASLIQPLNPSVLTINFSTLPFLTLGNATTDLPFLNPDPSLFSTNLPSFLLSDTLSSNFVNSNYTSTDYDYTFDRNESADSDNSPSLNNPTNTEEEEVNPFLAGDYNFYDYNPYDPNATFDNEPYDYSTGSQESEEGKDDEEDVMRLWDGVDVPPPIRPIPYNALTDLNPLFLWTPPILCFLALIFVVLPCYIFKIKDDDREKLGKTRRCSSFQTTSHFVEKMWTGDLERQAVAATSFTRRPGDSYRENVLYIEESNLNMKKESGKLVSKSLSVNEPPIDYIMQEYFLAPRSCSRSPSKEEGAEENLAVHCHSNSSSSGSFTPTKETGAIGKRSLGSSSGSERRVDDDSMEKKEVVKIHGNDKFSPGPNTDTNSVERNQNMYTNGAGHGPPSRKSSSKDSGANSPIGLTEPDWRLY